MKRMVTAFALLVVSVVLCIAGNRVTTNLTGNLTQTLSAAEQAASRNDRAQAYTLSKKACQDWTDAHQVLCTFQPHSRLETIDQTLATLPGLAKCDSLWQFASECARGKILAKNLQESELPLLQNIL
ncbi:MAG: DUF4363 family protein [Oscillospiraceae bacterium]|jgi:hypothetical protein|nr:DUF4363 family protein [Oscillospiraceae bacterium]